MIRETDADFNEWLEGGLIPTCKRGHRMVKQNKMWVWVNGTKYPACKVCRDENAKWR